MNWNERIKVYNHTAEFRAEIHPSMQAIYMIDGSDLAQQKAKKVSLAYLSMLTLENKDVRLKLLNAFQTHAEINEQKIFAPLDDEGAKIFRHLIHQLEDTSVFMEKGPRNLSQFFNILASQTAGYYQLRMGGHILTIAKRQGKNQQTNWYLYDANFGEIRVTTSDVQQDSHPMRVLLHDYFTRLKNVPQQDNRAVVFDVYQLDADKLSASIPFKKLTQFISNTRNNLLPSSPSTHETVKPQKNRVRQTMSRTYHTVGHLGQAHQGLSWIRSVTCLSHYWRRRSSDELMEPEKQALDFEAQLAISGLLYDVESTLLESGFRKLGAHLIQKFSSQAVRVFASRMQCLQYAAGLKLARYGGPFLSMLGAGFDIYQAQKAVTELETETAPDARQDLQVSLALSSLGASIGIASGLALLTLTGQMALMAGVMGIALGILTAVAGGIYFSVRQVQEIERYTTLTGLQKLRTGWLSFWGAEVDVEVTNQVTKGQAKEQAKKNVHDQFKKNLQTLLDSDTEIETVYYSTGNIILGEHRYQKLTGKRWTMLGNRAIPKSEYLFINNIKDKILPSKTDAILSDYQTQKWENQPLYMDLTLEDSQYKFYDIKALSPTDDKISLDTEAHSDGILSLNRLAAPASLSSSDMQSSPPNATNPAKIYFFLGDGDDEVVGHREKRNMFDIGDGVKNFKGGNQADMFIFNGTSTPAQPSVFDGMKGVNSLVANKKPSQGGYRVNLEEDTFSFADFQKIATLKNIDHVETCAETDDVILGNAQANILNGKGGYDIIKGFDGNDILVAQAGELYGGKGTDCYRVLQNTGSDPATLIIKEEDAPEALSPVFLDYAVTQIISIKKLKQRLFIQLRNDNQSITTLTLFYLYRSVEPKTRKLTSQYIFYTKDGVMFTGLPAEIAVNADEEEPEPLTLMAQYAPKFDQTFHFPETDSEKAPVIIQKMQHQNTPGVLDVRGETRLLPDCLRLLPQETGFDDNLQGDEHRNTLHSQKGQDILEGKGERDVYIIEDRPMGTEVSINNHDQPETGEPEQDILLLPFLLDDLEIRQEKKHVILSHLDSPTEHVTIRLMNFMEEKSYRHLSIMDKEGRIHTMRLNASDEPDLIVDQLIPDVTVSDGHHILSQLRQTTAGFSEVEQVLNVPSVEILQTLQTKMIPVISS
ncbi:Putative RTX-family protein 3 [Candidatus Hamiltonella defensa (Bemisia tabaci)]|nr:Putative RTX-family protein 3 [Candidatus Hamiltonella defensa (Bemisia tabaci)]